MQTPLVLDRTREGPLKHVMFGFSIQKLLVLAAIIGAVLYGFKFIGRLDKGRKDAVKAALREAKKRATGASEPPPASGKTMDLVQCDACGAFVAARGVTSCGREDCPYPG